VWNLYRAAVAQFGAVPTMIERDDNIPALGELVAELQSPASSPAIARSRRRDAGRAQTPLRELQRELQRHLLGEPSAIADAIVDAPPLPVADAARHLSQRLSSAADRRAR
jgi:hypothetical protein